MTNLTRTPDGILHPSQTAAAKHLGVSTAAVNCALKRRGDLKTCGIKGHGITEAARIMGMSRRCLNNRLERGYYDRMNAPPPPPTHTTDPTRATP